MCGVDGITGGAAGGEAGKVLNIWIAAWAGVTVDGITTRCRAAVEEEWDLAR
jgi:hypothetical protein